MSAGLASGLMTMGWKRGSKRASSSCWQFLEGQAHAVGNLRQEAIHFLGVIAQQQDAERWIVVHQHAPLAVEHGSAGRDHRDGSDAVQFGELGVAIGFDDLQLPKAEQQQTHHAKNEIGSEGQSRLRQAVFSLEPKRQRRLRVAPGSIMPALRAEASGS